MQVSLPHTLVVAVVSALLSSAGTSGGIMALHSTPAENQEELRSDLALVQKDLDALSRKIDDVYHIVDLAHPRIGIER